MQAFGFPVWTFAALTTGPIWARQAWVVYAAYLHARATAGQKGRNAALGALATLWFNVIGINFSSSSSRHSYAADTTTTTSMEAPL